MLYRVVVDGTDILDHSDPTMVLLSPQLNAEIDVSGSLEFTIPPNHRHYGLFTVENIMTMTVEVYEDEILQWFGRPMEFHLDFYNNKKIYCEGALSFFNDSIIREEEYDEVLLSTIFTAVIAEHNSMVPANRRFTIGNFTVKDEAVYRKFNYEQTADVLKSKFLDAVEGHFFFRRENGVNYIDFLKDMPYTCNQPVKFAENLLDFTYSFDAKDFATCVIPLGKTDSETQKPITIKSVNNNSDILVGNTASLYGQIVKVQQYSDIEDPNKLKSEGQTYLTTLQYNAYLIECSAVDLHATDGSKQLFRVGQTVHCISDPHSINLDLPISKMTLYLDSAAKQITLGRIPKKTLARFYKEINKTDEISEWETDEQESEIPEGWGIVPPDVDGGEPTLKKVPIAIQITQLPSKTTGVTGYSDGQTFDPTGIQVKLVAKGLPDLEYFTDEYYINSVCPMNELSFEINGSGIAEGGAINWTSSKLLVWVIWTCKQSGCPYKGKTFRKSFYIENKDAAAREAAERNPDHISVISTGLDYVIHKDGQYINTMGLVVKAYLEDGSEYNADGYKNGVIPRTELTIAPKTASYSAAQGGNGWVVDTDEGKITFGGGGESSTPITYSYVNKNGATYHGTVGTCSANAYYIVYNGKVYPQVTEVAFSGYELTASKTRPGVQGETTYTKNGKTVWYAVSNVGGSIGWHDGPITNVVPPPFFTATNFEHPEDVAWSMIWGDVKEAEKLQTITVSWKRPDGLTLTTSFQIKVADPTTPTGSQGGR